MKVLVTGGAGYVGSHVALQLAAAGHTVSVLDDLSTGHRWAVLQGELTVASLADEATLRAIVTRGAFDAVVHMAASVVVPESVRDPLKYYGNNTGNIVRLLGACGEAGVKHFIFSSTAAVYGVAGEAPITEREPVAPINPYGASKAMSERILADFAAATGLRYVALRYFNVAGADAQGRLGQATAQATHLIKVACEAALGQRPGIEIFGTDYPTRDGTCIRDYIHVDDLARAHVRALEHLAAGGASDTMNCGYGRGHSVREVLDCVRRISGREFPVTESARRPGDGVSTVADNRRIREVLGWQPQHDDLDFIVRTAYDWERRWAQRRMGA